MSNGYSLRPWPGFSLRLSLALTVALVLAGGVAVAIAPSVQVEAVARPFAQSIPLTFGDWKAVEQSYLQVDPTITRSGETSLNQPYDDVLARTYQNSRGELVMLSLAYGRQQRQEVKIHRPDLCYTAQGFKILEVKGVHIAVTGAQAGEVAGKRMKAARESQIASYTELVSYWMRIGTVYSESAWDTRMHILREGIAGRVPDGVLVRASEVVRGGEDEEAVHMRLESFLVSLVAAAPPDARRLMVR